MRNPNSLVRKSCARSRFSQGMIICWLASGFRTCPPIEYHGDGRSRWLFDFDVHQEALPIRRHVVLLPVDLWSVNSFLTDEVCQEEGHGLTNFEHGISSAERNCRRHELAIGCDVKEFS